ncbi:hypothetical protein SKAU_G00203690 [Synaphobranchus kaupii]|uniref:Uncharacterized protein n=1 Tax=Synaphobranchus kaupii TaxID=118154 RepID=A0A9Q1FGC8_SYNKA|nr:hypothetical protein SKAU_G00203690 [Synaphobranchus kaupii]
MVPDTTALPSSGPGQACPETEPKPRFSQATALCALRLAESINATALPLFTSEGTNERSAIWSALTLPRHGEGPLSLPQIYTLGLLPPGARTLLSARPRVDGKRTSERFPASLRSADIVSAHDTIAYKHITAYLLCAGVAPPRGVSFQLVTVSFRISYPPSRSVRKEVRYRLPLRQRSFDARSMRGQG